MRLPFAMTLSLLALAPSAWGGPPEDFGHYEREAKRRLKKGDRQGAIDDLQTAYRLGHRADDLVEMATIYRSMGDQEHACKALRDFMKVASVDDPRGPEALEAVSDCPAEGAPAATATPAPGAAPAAGAGPGPSANPPGVPLAADVAAPVVAPGATVAGDQAVGVASTGSAETVAGQTPWYRRRWLLWAAGGAALTITMVALVASGGGGTTTRYPCGSIGCIGP